MSMWLGHLFWQGGRQYALWSLKISSRFVRRRRRTSSVWVWTFISGSQTREQRDRRMLLALDLDDAHPAGAEARQLGLVAQGRDLDAVVAADLEDGLALEALDDAAVDLDADRAASTAAAAATASRAGARPANPRSSAAVVAGSGALGAGQGVGHRGASVAAGTGRLAGSNWEPKYRIPLVSGRVARRSWSHRAEATMSWARSVGELRRRWAGRGRARDGRRSRPGAWSRCGTGSTCRMPRSSRTGSGRRRARRRSVRSSTTITEPEPRWAPAARRSSNEYGRVERIGRQQAARRPADQDGLERPTGRQRAAQRRATSRSGRAQRDLGDAVAARRAQLDEDGAGAVLRADRGEGRRRRRG